MQFSQITLEISRGSDLSKLGMILEWMRVLAMKVNVTATCYMHAAGIADFPYTIGTGKDQAAQAVRGRSLISPHLILTHCFDIWTGQAGLVSITLCTHQRTCALSRSRHAQTTHSYQVFKSTHVAVVYRSGWTDLAVHAPQHRVTSYTRVLRFTFSETGRGCIYKLLIWTLSLTQQFTCICKDLDRVGGLLLV